MSLGVGMLVVRRVLGVAGLVVGGLLLVLLPVAYLGGLMWGAAGDRFQRIILVGSLVALTGFVVAAVAFSEAPIRSTLRRRVVIIGVVVLALGFAWAAFGIDSTRPVRALPEASITFPGAIELGRGASAAEGGFDAVARAAFFRSFATTGEPGEVEAFYRAELGRRGWGEPHRSSLGESALVDWEHQGFDLQLGLASMPSARHSG